MIIIFLISVFNRSNLILLAVVNCHAITRIDLSRTCIIPNVIDEMQTAIALVVKELIGFIVRREGKCYIKALFA